MFVLPGVTIWNQNDPTIYEIDATDATFLRIDGTVLAADTSAVLLVAPTGSPADTVVVEAAGAVHAAPPYSGIFLTGAAARIDNAGQVSGQQAVFLDSALFGILNNSGTLTGIGGAAVRLLLSASVTLTNEGTIRGDTGIELIDSYATILNSGSIVATAYGGSASIPPTGSGRS